MDGAVCVCVRGGGKGERGDQRLSDRNIVVNKRMRGAWLVMCVILQWRHGANRCQ